MKVWRFMDYYTEVGDNWIRQWFDTQGENIRAEMDMALQRLAGFRNWNEQGEFEILRKQHKGLCEIKFGTHGIGKKRQFRIAGFFHFNDPIFILATACEKRGQSSTYAAFDLAMTCKKQFEAGRGDIHESFFFSHLETT